MTDPELTHALASSRRLGMLGIRPIDEVIDHAGAFVEALASVRGTVVDLGSGGGVPGLVVARARPDLHLILVERRATRADHLRRLVRRLELGERVDVHDGDVATLAPVELVDAVVARGFAAPAVTAVAGARLLRVGGVLVVSEPPAENSSDSGDVRWPPELLHDAGLAVVAQADARVICLRRTSAAGATTGPGRND